MNKGARDKGTQPGSANRLPGWMSRTPAMNILLPSHAVFRSLRPLAIKLSSWSHDLASRWSPLHRAGKTWRGILDLSLRSGRTFSARRNLLRTPNSITRKRPAHEILQTLSLPEGFSIEEPLDAGEEQFASLAVEQSVEPSPTAPVGGLLSAGSDNQTILASPTHLVEDLPFLPSATTEIQKISANLSAPVGTSFRRGVLPDFTGSAPQKISRPAWPFRLVSPLAEKKQPAASIIARGKIETGAQRTPQLLSARAAGGVHSPGRFLARSRVPQANRETTRSRLVPRPMAAGQLSITTTQSPITVLGPGQGLEMLTLFEGRWQPPSRQYTSGEETGGPLADQPPFKSEPRSASKRTLQRKVLPETRGIQAEPAPFRSTQPVLQPFPFLASSAQVRPPDAMLILHPASQPKPEADQVFGRDSIQSVVEQEWPLLSVLRRLETQPEEPADPASVQVLRRMWPAQAPLVRRTLQELTSVGTGERLSATVSKTMQARLGRDLGDVRLHTSPLVQTLRAEAFTSGRNVVFAPGRLDVSTSKGLALLGHELTHIGQPLAFKQESGAGQVFEDSQERVARQQEDSIQRIVEQGWPKTHSMELQHPARPGAAAPAPGVSATSTFIQRLAEENTGSAQSTDTSGAPSAPSSATVPSGQPAGGAPSGGQAGPPTSTGPAGAPAPNANVDGLARQVYGILKNRLRAEHDRRHLYNF